MERLTNILLQLVKQEEEINGLGLTEACKTRVSTLLRTAKDALAEAEMIGLRPVSLSRQDNIPKTLSVRQLTEHQDSQLVPAGEVLDIFITPVSLCYSEEYERIKV